LARPYLVEDLHLLSFASFAWRTLRWVNLALVAISKRGLLSPQQQKSERSSDIDA